MELIDRQEVVNLICDSKDFKELFDRVYDEIPIIESRPKGKWIDKGDYADCSICGAHSGVQYDGVQPVPLKTKYCPNCGADMRGEK